MPTYPDLFATFERDARDAKRRHDTATAAIQAVLDRAKAQGRDLTAEEQTAVEARFAERDRAREALADVERKIERLTAAQREDDEVDQAMRRIDVHARDVAGRGEPIPDDGPRWVRSADQRPATVARGQRFADHDVVQEYAATRARADAAVTGTHGSLGNLIRSMTTVSGSAVVPTLWSADIIDRARNNAAVLQAGAEVVPMDAKVVQIGRLITDPTAAFRAEGSLITASDPAFDNVTLTATTMSALLIGSLEWFMDAPNADVIVEEAIGKAVALQLDLAALFGGMTTGSEAFNLPTPPNPRGVLAALLALAPSSVLGAGANGTPQTALTAWNEVIDAVYQVKSFNENPSGIIWNSKLSQQYAKTYDSTGQPLEVPELITNIPRFESNQVPSFTQGTMVGRATDLFVGDWEQLLIGQRLDFVVQTLTERYAEFGQVGIVAHWRGDIQLARPRAFSVYRYLQGAV